MPQLKIGEIGDSTEEKFQQIDGTVPKKIVTDRPIPTAKPEAAKSQKQYSPPIEKSEPLRHQSPQQQNQLQKKPQPNPTKMSEKELVKEPKVLPYVDPSWILGFQSPFYKESHRKLQKEVRKWVDERIMPYVNEWDENYRVPEEIFQDLGKRGYLAGLTGLPYDTKYGKYRCASVKPEEWDGFHEMVVVDELARTGSGGLLWNLVGGFAIGLPPFMKFGQESVKQRVLPEILDGEKRVCLCITEAEVGSDVANLTTTAEKTPDGKYYIVNGLKKWITNGIFSEYFTVAVRTGPPGLAGVSLLLIERKFDGVETRQMKCQGMWSSGTTLVTFDDVKVPVENLIGKENRGFQTIMTNFNHERLGMIIQANRLARVCYEEALKHSFRRQTFGKRLIDHEIIKLKLAQMAGRVEAVHSFLESVIYQSNSMGQTEAMGILGGPVASLKAQSTQTFAFCASEAAQVFGGVAYTRGGVAEKVERAMREFKAYTIAGGSEEIMLLLSMNQGIRLANIISSRM